MGNSEKQGILIVDDRPENLVVLESLLEGRNRNIIKAASGNEALALALEHDLALILLDVQMPDMDGFETAELLRGIERTKYVPIIFVTAISHEEKHVFKGYEVGAVDYLFKPIEPEILKSKVNVFLALHRKTIELKKALETIESQHKELEQSYNDLKAVQSQILQQEKMASIGQLAAGVAHEINNPVGFIMSNLGSLHKYIDKLSEFIKIQTEAIEELSCNPPISPLEKGGEGGFDNIIDKIKESQNALKIDYIMQDIGSLIKESLEGAERVKKIVQDLKSFSHVDESEHNSIDINAGIESTINIVWNELKYKATVKKEYGDIPPTKCNAGQLNQVFMNILVNAAHAIEKQGEITIKTWHENNDIFVSISDTGHGIPADKINRIFEPFFTTKEVGKGTGLGLSIAYDIVKKHNGDIMVESEVGRGTTFTVKIPVVER
ncbi:MAG: ATP-binding protein [Nitrospirae bacterium]|nr:ATP-binding protein [Nitrospirota bacterium]MCL5977995.1 ATP-binding protein [Nitrospirota bacterium]